MALGLFFVGKLVRIEEDTIPTSSSTSGFTRNSVHYANNEANGAYYGWCVATAGSCSSAKNDGAVASNSICPKRWKLPTKAEYNTLLNMGYEDKSTIEANKGLTVGGGFFPTAGRVDNSHLNFTDKHGYYYSSTVRSSDSAYYLFFSSSDVSITSGYSSFYGFPIRCSGRGC